MAEDNNYGKILICQVTRRNMQYSFIWPSFEDELNPGKHYYIKISLFLLGYSLLALSTFMHLIVTLRDELDLHISEDIAVTSSNIGIWYMATIYVRNQPKIARLLRDLSDFENFGKPPNFDEINKKLNFWSWFAIMYPTLGSSSYVFIKLSQKSLCEEMNAEHNLDEKCGLMYPFWIPFDINYFPVFYIFFLFAWISAMLFVRFHLSIFFQSLEIVTNIILRIKHLSTMITDTFDKYECQLSRRKFTRCVEYHQEILDMTVRLDESFSGLMLLHFIMTATICGCLEKQFFDGVYPATAAVHLMGWILSLFLASLGGQQILDASESFAQTVYASKWYLADIQLQKDLMFLLEKSQRILKMSYSILAMLTS